MFVLTLDAAAFERAIQFLVMSQQLELIHDIFISWYA